MIKLVLCCLVGILPLIAFSSPLDSILYRIYDARAQREITLADLAEALHDTDVIFFGEEHNDSIAHVLQYELLKTMDERYHEVALSMEMFVSDDQLILDEYLAGLITERNLNKDVVLWNNYNDYRPMVEYAKERQLRVLAANAPSRYTNRVTREGLESLDSLSETAKALLAPLPIDTLTGNYHDKFAGLMGGHEGMGNLKIYQSQSLWDATMAYRISLLAKCKPDVKIMHLNGRFHSDEKLGTVAQLRRYAPELSIMNISCFPHEGFIQPNWSEFVHLGDYIILTDPTIARTF
ncbi:ChaN family lipoprotein [Parapedobacter tibetensis]|uniref:ChaN family lipoprotein n=1 Tax=Parapedobacter tibetensis TaxID=2972951 RepID=UPI00214DD28F|nr:ChaN family lipoprotein [Parapedobacter tibetensis]